GRRQPRKPQGPIHQRPAPAGLSEGARAGEDSGFPPHSINSSSPKEEGTLSIGSV
ncbi:uncharacterized protein P884DRAFT_332856, partial [Thermothelomyces heterothallicus CBS 202.75]|uniref:uncharacterized protein n=1 Tax=Thermothelomyces heterothallicus CBS 202.75 TaxID=1149848 RepID=UPI003743CAA5